MPPKLPPKTQAQELIPNLFNNISCELTQSSTEMSGKSFPYISFVFGQIEVGPVEPKQLPKLFGDTTKNL